MLIVKLILLLGFYWSGDNHVTCKQLPAENGLRMRRGDRMYVAFLVSSWVPVLNEHSDTTFSNKLQDKTIILVEW